MTHALQQAAQRLRSRGVLVDELDPPAGWHELRDAAFTVNHYEGARSHRARFEQHGTRIGIRLADLVRTGLQIPEEEYQAARAVVERMRVELASLFREYPAVLTPAATGAAPAGLSATGDPANNAPWTALGVPAISVPLQGSGAPLGLQITAAWGRDDALVAAAAEAERLLN
jgi:Asp-tRNA(Asn)/Glu-tRNA(Gln) amidotransferase A subunit family amidase